jgi:ATP-dependent RNA helicase HelY
MGPSPDRRKKAADRRVRTLTDSPHLAQHRQRIHLEQAGVGAHHSGHLPGWKLVVEP